MRLKNFIIFACFVLVVLFVFSRAGGPGTAGKMRLAKASGGPMKEYLKLRGKVELERREKVYSQIPGLVERIFADEGRSVTSGEVLASMDPRDADIALRRAVAAKESAAATFAEVKNSVRDEQISQAEAQLSQCEIALETARRDYAYKKDRFARIEALVKKGSAPEQDQKDTRVALDISENALRDAEKRRSIAQYNLQLLKKGSSENMVRAAQFTAEQAATAVDELSRMVEKTRIRAGIGGVVLAKLIDPNAFVQPGMPLFEIGDTSSAHIRVDVLVDDMARVATGARASVTGDAIGGAAFSAEVYFIAPRAFTKISSLGVEQQKIEVRLKYPLEKISLRPGYELDVNIVTRERADTVYVPYKAVFDKDGSHTVFTVKNGALELRKVETGIENDEFIEITGGLSAGERVVVDPPNTLAPGMRVTE